MEGPHIKYNQEHGRLESALRSVDRAGDYFVEGRLVGAMPRMKVRSVGTIAFPILESQARSLIQAAERAPYGRGPDTVLDTSVRDCWQIDGSRVELSGARWQEAFRSILESVAEGLGCQRDSIGARLYKLLVYERGGFFSEHRDTEKVSGMIATLVVTLPAEGTGGELVIRHKDRETTVNLSGDDPGELAFAAFYADCEHLTKPILTGYRVSLVYNVVVKRGSRSAPPRPPDYSKQVDEISGILAGWASTGVGPSKIVWLLEHEYSEAGLSFPALKGLDVVVGQTLAQAAKLAGCALHLAILRIEESGTPDYDDIDFEEYGREIDYTGRTCSIEDLYESSYSLGAWVDKDSTGSDLPEIPLLDGEALPNGALDAAEPDEQTLLEASGNEGVSLDRSYRSAAFVLWPHSQEAPVIADGSINAAIDYVERKLAGARTQTGSGFTGTELVSRLIDSWPSNRSHRYSILYRDQKDQSFPRMLRLLSRVSSDEQSVRFLCAVAVKQYGVRMNDALEAFLRGIDPSALALFFRDFMRTNIPLWPGDALALLAQLCTGRPARNKAEWYRVLEIAAREAFRALPQALEPVLPAGEPEWRRPRPQPLDAKAVRDLFVASHGFAMAAEADTAIALFSRCPKQVDPFRTLPTALVDLRRHGHAIDETRGFGALWHLSSSQLLGRSAVPPQAPTDERIDAPISCNCSLCGEFAAFCLDRHAKTKRIKAVAHVRGHLEQSIQRADLDIKFHTDTSGRPYTLVCVKTPKSYRRRREQYAQDIDRIRQLISARPSDDSPESARTLAQLREAIAPSD